MEGVEDPGTIAYPNGVMFMSDDPAVRAASEKFISFLLEPDNYGRFLNMEPGLFLPVTDDGANASSFWDDPTTTKYRSQVETMIENSQSGRLFGFTNGNTFPSIASISAQNLIAETVQEIVTNGMDPGEAVAATQKKMEEATQE
jgi:multiple sugar transport system substrate-binding protein